MDKDRDTKGWGQAHKWSRIQVDWNTDGQGLGHRKTGTETQTDRQRAGTQTDRKRYTDRQREEQGHRRTFYSMNSNQAENRS
jgi:hypothetical protein